MTTFVVIAVIAALVAAALATVLVVRARRRPRTIPRGSESGHALPAGLTEIREPGLRVGQAPGPAVAVGRASVERAHPAQSPVPARPGPRPAAERGPAVTAPPSLVGAGAALEADRAFHIRRYEHRVGVVELGFLNDPERVGVRAGSPAERAFAFYAGELLADLRSARSRRT